MKSVLNKLENVAYYPTTEHLTIEFIGLVFEGVPEAKQLSLVLSSGIIVLGNVIIILPSYLIGS